MNTTLPPASSLTDPFEQNRSAGYPTISQSWWLIGVFFLAQIPASFPMLGLKAAADSFNLPLLNTVGQTLGYVVSLVITIWYAMRKRGGRAVSFAAAPVAAYPVAAIGLLAMSTLAEPLLSAIPMPRQLEEMIAKLFTKDLIFTAVVAAPILEEVLFRGIILDGFLKNYQPAKAILWSAFLFGFIHLIPNQALNAMFIGVALGWLYYRTRSLWLCMFLHFVNNALSSLVFLFGDTMDMSQNLTRDWVGSDLLYAGLLAGCVVVCLSCYAYLNRILPKPAISVS